MRRKNTEFPVYEPGEPDDVKAKEKAVADKQARHERIVHAIKGTGLWIFWIAVILSVFVLIVFGINRWVHAVNEDIRYKESFYSSCVSGGNQVVNFNSDTVCFSGTVVDLDITSSEGKNACLSNGDFPMIDNSVPYHLCMRGKVVAVR